MSVDRVACPKCGSNNFATQARCWSCGTPLGGGAPAPASGAAPVSAPLPSSQANPATAIWACVALGLLFPFVAVPVGIVFLMLDDKRKGQIGWQAILWGSVGTVVQMIATAALGSMLTGPLLQASMRSITQMQAQRQSALPSDQ